MLKFKVADVSYGHCAGTIETAAKSADPAAKVSIDIAGKEVRIESGLAPTIFPKAIAHAGYSGAFQG